MPVKQMSKFYLIRSFRSPRPSEFRSRDDSPLSVSDGTPPASQCLTLEGSRSQGGRGIVLRMSLGWSEVLDRGALFQGRVRPSTPYNRSP